MQALGGVKMELEDCGFDLLTGVVVTKDPVVAFTNVDVVIGLGQFWLQIFVRSSRSMLCQYGCLVSE